MLSGFEQLLFPIAITNLSKYYYSYVMLNKLRHRKIPPKFLQVIQLRNAETKNHHTGLLDPKAQG